MQGTLEHALAKVLGESDSDGGPLKLTVAGRTDRGVHAWGQVASYRHEAVDPQRLNTLLPDDVAVITAEPAPAAFDARRDAVSRIYCYRILTRRTRSAFMASSALWWPQELDRHALDACAALVVGTHDFTAFTPTETEHVRFQRQVLRAQWSRPGSPRSHSFGADPSAMPGRSGHEIEVPAAHDLLEFWIEADTFLRHMNRVLVGTMLEVACGRRTVDEFELLLTGRPRVQAGPTAPAHGLVLAAVRYPGD